jgi:hypothetical protein
VSVSIVEDQLNRVRQQVGLLGVRRTLANISISLEPGGTRGAMGFSAGRE